MQLALIRVLLKYIAALIENSKQVFLKNFGLLMRTSMTLDESNRRTLQQFVLNKQLFFYPKIIDFLYLLVMHPLFKRSEHREINKKMMKIGLNFKNDIKIQWNFSGIMMPKVFRRHVFLSLSWDQIQIDKGLQAMKNCFQCFKSGDLYTFATPTQKKLNWFEKIKIDNFMCSYEPDLSHQQEEEKCFIKYQLLSLSKFRQPCFVVIFCDPKINVQQVEGLIQQLRSENFKSFVFIVSSQQNYSKGILKIGQKNPLSLERVYKYYNDHLACLQTKITIQSKNGEIFFQQGAMKSNSFESFNRTFYYPLANQFVDTIQTYKLYSENNRQWRFIVKLEYKLLDGQIFRDQKQIKVPLEKDIEKYITFNFSGDMIKKYQLFFGFDLKENPFVNTTTLLPGVGLKNN